MTIALISLYHPSASVAQNVAAIAAQVDAVYLCDNSPISNFSMFAGMNIPANVHYTCFQENLGLSCAFNKMLKDPCIGWNDDDFIIFFDQDSKITEGHIQKMLAEYINLQEHGFPIGCLGCVFFNTSHGAVEIPKARKPLLDGTYAVSGIITSSMLCTYHNLKSVDFWNEHIFLDMADWDLCWRLIAKGKLCCITELVILHHSVGSSEKKIGPLKLRVGQPIREYYQIRECLHLLTQPYTPLKYRIRFLAMLLIRSPLHVLFLDQKKQRFRFILRGFFDFFRKKQGPLDLESAQEIHSL